MMYRLATSEWLDRLGCLVVWLLGVGLPGLVLVGTVTWVLVGGWR